MLPPLQTRCGRNDLKWLKLFCLSQINLHVYVCVLSHCKKLRTTGDGYIQFYFSLRRASRNHEDIHVLSLRLRKRLRGSGPNVKGIIAPGCLCAGESVCHCIRLFSGTLFVCCPESKGFLPTLTNSVISSMTCECMFVFLCVYSGVGQL